MATRPYGKHIVSATAPASPQAGDEWYNQSTSRLYKWLVVSGMAPQWVELTQQNLLLSFVSLSGTNTWTGTQTFSNSTYSAIFSGGASVFGSGDATATVGSGTIRGASATGTNLAGADLIMASGSSTGNATGGNISFRVSPPGTSGSTANTAAERVKISNTTLTLAEIDVAMDKAVVTQQAARVSGFSVQTSGMNGSPTLSYALTIPAASNRLLVAYQLSNQSGTFGTAPTYPKGGVSTSMTLLTTVTSNAYMAIWYMTNPDSSGTITFNSNGCAYYGTAVDCFYNVDQTAPTIGVATAGASVGNTSVSITVSNMTSAHNLVIGVFDGWGKNPASTTSDMTQQWSITGDASWRSYGYQIIPTLGSTSQTLSLSMTATNDSYTFTGFALKGTTSANPVAFGTANSALNITFGGASTLTIPTSTTGLVISSSTTTGIMTFDGSGNTVTLTGKLYPSAGTAALPSISQSGNTNTGLYFPASNVVGISTAGSERFRVDGSGNVGIGTTNPYYKLHVSTTTALDGIDISATSSEIRLIPGGNISTGNYNNIVSTGDNLLMFNGGSSNTGNFVIAPWSSGTSGIKIQANGNVGVGQPSPGSTLDVKGTIRLSGSTSGYVGLAPAAAAGSTTYTLPSSDGTNGQVLTTNGSATLSWSTATSSTSAGARSFAFMGA